MTYGQTMKNKIDNTKNVFNKKRQVINHVEDELLTKKAVATESISLLFLYISFMFKITSVGKCVSFEAVIANTQYDKIQKEQKPKR